MEKLMEIRGLILEQYLRWERYLKPLGKFLAALLIMFSVNSRIGYNGQLKSWFVTLGISVISAFLPVMFLTVAAALVSIGHIFSASFVLAGTVGAVFIILYFMLLRFVPKHAWAVVAIPVLFLYRLQFLVPVVLGLIATPLSILAAAAGVVVYYILKMVREFIKSGLSASDYMNLYQMMIDGVLENKEMFYTIIIFSLVILVVFLIRIQKIDYGFEWSIGAGTLVGLIGFLITGLADGKVLSIILGSIVSGALVLGIWFLFLALDYTETEELQFQDDNYYYYVRAVPKVKIEKKKRNVKRMN